MTRILFVFILLAATGCHMQAKKPGTVRSGAIFASYDLEAEWLPLERLHERPEMLGSDSKITTVGKTAYVADLKDWLTKRPPGSFRYRSILRHEQEHARRQLKKGVLTWVAKYATDRKFMWIEEARGWYYQIQVLRQHGQRINIDGVAKILSNYKNLAGRMVSFVEAKAWVESVLQGSWKPPS